MAEQLTNLDSPKNRRVLLIALIVLVGTWLSTGYHYVLGVYWEKPYPVNTFLFRPWDRFTDFYDQLEAASEIVRGVGTEISYSPFASAIMALFNLAYWPKVALYIAVILFTSTLGVLIWRYLTDGLKTSPVIRAMVSFILLTMTYPVLFAVDRGNEEMFVFVALAAFAYLYFKKHSPWAGVFLGAAIAYKMVPIVFLVLFLAHRRWKDLAITIATAVGFTLVSVLGLGAASGYGPVGILQCWYETLFGGHMGYSMTLGATQHSHTFWLALVALTGRIQGGNPVGLSQGVHFVVAVVVFLALTAYVVFVERNDGRRMAILTIAMLTLPFESHDYTLIHLLVPLAMFANSKSTRADVWLSVLFGIALIPFDYGLVVAEASAAVFVYPMVLLLLAILFIRQGFADHATRPAAGSIEPVTQPPRQ